MATRWGPEGTRIPLLIPPLFLMLFFSGAPLVAEGRLRSRVPAPKPDPSDAAATARWLAAQNSWGVLR